jgi:L-malate glycosyltransferase
VRVAYVNHTSKFGGAEISLCLLLKHIDRTKVAPVLICPEGPLAQRARELQVETVTTDFRQMGYARGGTQALSYAVGVLRSARNLSRQLRTIRPDIVHANTLRAGVIAGAAKLVFRASGKLVVHVRDCPPPCLQTRLALEAAGRRADRVIAISDYVRDHLTRIGGPTNKISVVWDGVDTKLFDPESSGGESVIDELELRDCYPVISKIAQITPWKGQLEVARAFASVARDFPNARLLIVGEAKFGGAESRFDIADYERKLHEAVEQSGIVDKVRFTGERTDIPSVIAASDILVHASWEEPFGLIVVEAMSMAKPVVATQAGAIPEIIDNEESGLLVPPKDPDAIAKAVVRLAGDAELSRRLGQAAAKKARECFDAARVVADMTGLYRDVAAQ